MEWWKGTRSFSNDSLEWLQQNPPPSVQTAYLDVIECIRSQALVCMHWLLCRYPEVSNMGRWYDPDNVKPLEYCVSRNRRYTSRARYLPDMVLMLLQAGAAVSPRPGRLENWGLLEELISVKRPSDDRDRLWEAAMHLVDYGAWVSYDHPNRPLYAAWEQRFRRRDARARARVALILALRKRGANRDVARLVAMSRPLSDRLSWKEWTIE
jgi:hypothetical protein